MMRTPDDESQSPSRPDDPSAPSFAVSTGLHLCLTCPSVGHDHYPVQQTPCRTLFMNTSKKTTPSIIRRAQSCRGSVCSLSQSYAKKPGGRATSAATVPTPPSTTPARAVAANSLKLRPRGSLTILTFFFGGSSTTVESVMVGLMIDTSLPWLSVLNCDVLDKPS